MNDKIIYKEPNDEQLKLMRQFSDICSEGMKLILKCESNVALQNSSIRMQESMMWFHSYIINGGKISKE